MGIQFPEMYGGAAMSAIDYCLCIEELARVDPSVSLSVAAHNGLGPAHIRCSAPRRRSSSSSCRWLAARRSAPGRSPSRTGQRRRGHATTATREGECWVLNGAKTFITHGASGDVMVVMAVTDRRAAPRASRRSSSNRGTPGADAGKEGRQARDARQRDERGSLRAVPRSRRHLLGEEGQGFINALQVLDAGRIGIAALSVGLAQGAFEAAAAYAQERRQFGQAISLVPGDPMEARRQRHAHRGRAAADVPRRVFEGSRPPDDAGVGHGEALRERDCRAAPPKSACRSTAATAS